ncbi:MAG: recombinase family protein [Clostridia bacterium]|nr:recombinase family protein [Clostridia bacterium]
MTIYGYARVRHSPPSREGDSLEAQINELKEAGAEQIVLDLYTGSKADRPNLKLLISKLQPGDQLVFTKLGRFASSLIQGEQLISELIGRDITVNILILGVLDNTPEGRLIRQALRAAAEFEREQIIERTQTGKAPARLHPSFRDGRPPLYSNRQKQHALELFQGGRTYREVTEMTGISKSTLILYKRRVQNEQGTA